jgi:Protein of unknown function (DUF2752)
LAWRKPNREERQLAWLWGVVAACSLLLRPFWLELAPFVPACPFRAITGIPCPTCGTTHAALALLNGRLGDALSANPLAALGGIAFIVGGFLAPAWATFRWPIPSFPTPLPGWSRAMIVAILLAGWAYLIGTSR